MNHQSSHPDRSCAWMIVALLSGLSVFHSPTLARAQAAECDALAASPLDASRPAGVSGIAYEALDPAKAVPACEAAFRTGPGNARIKYQLARALQKSGEQLERAAQLTREAAESGHIGATNNYGALLLGGIGLKRDDRAAFDWFSKAAAAGFPLAMRQVGIMLMIGQGVPQNSELSTQWFLRAAEAGDATSALHYAAALESGTSVQKDEVEAANWYLRAGDGGVISAWRRLGVMFQGGRGVAKNPAEANVLFRKAADAGDTDAMLLLATNLRAGYGVDKNLTESLRWFQKAGLAGSVPAMLEVGKMLQSGAGGAVDEARAIIWYKMAAETGNDEARQILAAMTGKNACAAQLTPAATVAACDRWLAASEATGADRVEGLRHRSSAHLELGHHNEALADVDAALRLKPNDVGLLLTRSVANELLRRLDAAILDATRAIQIEPANGRTYLRRGSVFHRAKQIAAAIDDFSACIKISLSDLCLEARANAYVDLNQPQKAITDLTEAIRIDPKRARFYSARGYAYALTDNAKAAEADLRAALSIDPKDQQALDALKQLEQYKSREQAIATRNADAALCDAIDKPWSDRKDACLRLLADPDATPSRRAFVLFGRATDAAAAGRSDDAIADLTQAILVNPHAIYLQARADVYQRAGKLAEALADADKAIALDPTSAAAYFTRGFIHTDLGNDRGAVDDFSRAIERDQRHLEAWIQRGGARFRLGDKTPALADLNHSLSIKPTYEAYIYLGLIASELKDRAGAIDKFSKAIAIAPREHLAYVKRGSEYNKSIKPDEALRDLTKAIELQPRDAEAYSSRAVAWRLKKREREAIADATRAIELAPAVAEYYNIRGSAHFGLGDKQRAIADLRKALALDPKSDTARHNLNLIGEKP